MPEHFENAYRQTVQQYLLETPHNRLRYGIGCAWVGWDYNDKPQVKKDLQMLETAYRLGFRYYDTATGYGQSELLLGEFIPTVPRPSLFLATKTYLPRASSPQQAAEHVRKSLDKSLRQLQTSYLDLFQLHDFDSMENVFVAGGVLEVLQEAKRQGLIRCFGAAVRYHDLLTQAVQSGEFDTILTYQDFTPINQSAAQVIDLAHAAGMGVINASPLAGLHRLKLDFKDPAVLAAALHFPLSNSSIDMNLTGPGNAGEVQSSYAALNREADLALWEAWRRQA